MYPRRPFPAGGRAQGSNIPDPSHARSGNQERPPGTPRQQSPDRLDYPPSHPRPHLRSRPAPRRTPPTCSDFTPRWELAPSKLARIVGSLVEAGWDIEAEGKIFRRPGAFRIEVSSGVDWFELHGEVEYGNSTARLPELLGALRRGDKMVRLDD